MPSSDRGRRRWSAAGILYQTGLAGFYHPASLQARARVAELADARVLDARERKLFRVQVPALAPESQPWSATNSWLQAAPMLAMRAASSKAGSRASSKQQRKFQALFCSHTPLERPRRASPRCNAVSTPFNRATVG